MFWSCKYPKSLSSSDDQLNLDGKWWGPIKLCEQDGEDPLKASPVVCNAIYTCCVVSDQIVCWCAQLMYIFERFLTHYPKFLTHLWLSRNGWCSKDRSPNARIPVASLTVSRLDCICNARSNKCTSCRHGDWHLMDEHLRAFTWSQAWCVIVALACLSCTAQFFV